MPDDSSPTIHASPRKSAILIVIVLVCGGPFIAAEVTGEFKQPALHVGEPVHTIPERATVIGYESLSTTHQDTFREANGQRYSILDSKYPPVDYVRLDGVYYPLHQSPELPPPYHMVFTFGALAAIGPATLVVIHGCIALGPRLRALFRLADTVFGGVGSRVSPALAAVLVSSSTAAALLLISPDSATIAVSQQPVADPKLANASVVHVSDLPTGTQSTIWQAIKSGTERPLAEVTYQHVSSTRSNHLLFETDGSPLSSVDYIRTDGEVFHVKTIDRVVSLVYISFSLLVSAVVGLLVLVWGALYDGQELA